MQRNNLVKELYTYENNIFNCINDISINNYFDNMLLESKMNNIFNKINNKSRNTHFNYNSKNKPGMNLVQYISKANIKKEKYDLNNSILNDKTSNKIISEDLLINKIKNKKNSKKTKLINKNEIFKSNTSNANIKKIIKKSLFTKNEIKSERIHNYSSNKIRLRKNNKMPYENKLINNKTFKNNRNNKTNFSFLFRNSFNKSLSKKIINSNNSLNLQKNHSIKNLNNTNQIKDKISRIYYSNTYTNINNKINNKYPIKLTYINFENSFENNKICSTEPSIPMKYKRNLNLRKKADRYNNQNKIYKISFIEEKRKKLFNENKRKNKI